MANESDITMNDVPYFVRFQIFLNYTLLCLGAFYAVTYVRVNVFNQYAKEIKGAAQVVQEVTSGNTPSAQAQERDNRQSRNQNSNNTYNE